VPAETIARGLKAFQPVAGRLRRLRATAGFELIDDSYNANPDSVRAAIDVLADEPAPRLLVLGDMGEVGTQGPEFHREVGGYARERGIDRLFAAGDMAREAVASFGAGARHFESVDALAQTLARTRAQSQPQAPAATPDSGADGFATVLVKGSRFMRMERVVRALAPEAAGGGAH